MPWMYLTSARIAKKDGWTNAKGTIAKVTVGKTGITEKIGEIHAALAKIDANKFGLNYVTKDPKGDKAAVLAEIVKVEAVKPKVVELMKLANDAKTKHKTMLPSSAKKYLDDLIKDCAEFPNTIKFIKDSEIAEYGKKGA